jgi:glycosyltransferase involved in cell wall biosynthesis
MRLIIEKPAIVITPTIGSDKLYDALESVARQTYKNVKHLVVIDGQDYADKARAITSKFPSVILMQLPFNTGANGFYGHRVYAGIPHLLNSDYVFFLDEDNWYEPEHISELAPVLERNNFAYSLRKVFSPDKKFVCEDNCESLGKWPIFFTHEDPQYLVDTSSFAFNLKFLQATCHLWHSGWGGDRRYFYSVMQNATFDTSGKHTLCYRLDGNPGSVNADFFIQGNMKQSEHYEGKFPWISS